MTFPVQVPAPNISRSYEMYVRVLQFHGAFAPHAINILGDDYPVSACSLVTSDAALLLEDGSHTQDEDTMVAPGIYYWLEFVPLA